MTAGTRKLGKYEIIEELGRGGFATVYRAVDTTLEREVALKVLDPRLFRDSTFVARFRQEAVIAANLDHPNIVPVYEVAEAEGRHYIAMKLIQGPTLAGRIEAREALPIDEILSLTKDITAGLDHIHGQGLVHRDLKPSNVLISREGRAMLADFGLVRATEGSRVSTQGVSVGTPSYMAPEQAQGETVDARTDLYALGVILYEAVTGRLPFSADTPPALLFQHVYEAPGRPSELNDQVTPALEYVILRALEKDPDARYQTASALAADLVRAVAGRLQPPTAQPEGEPVAAPSSRPAPARQPAPRGGKPRVLRWGALGCLAILLCIAGSIGAWMLGQSRWFAASPSPTGPTEALAVATATVGTPTGVAEQSVPSAEPTAGGEASSAETSTAQPTATLPPPTEQPVGDLIERRLTDDGGDVEPNDTFISARRIRFGEQVEGVIDRRGDLDHYYFFGEKGTKVTVDLQAEVIGSKLDGYLSIWDPEGQIVKEDSGGWFSDGDPRIENWSLPETGVFFIQVQENGNDIGGANYPYKLSLEPPGIPEPAEISPTLLIPEQEDNDAMSGAMQIEFGDKVLGGIAKSGDRDYYSFDGYGGTRVVIDINAAVDGSALDSYLSVWSALGSQLQENRQDYHTTDSRLSFILPWDGRYFVRVEQSENDAGGQNYFYTLSLTSSDGLPGPTATPVVYVQEIEPNNTLSTATDVLVGATIRGTIERVGDVDYFRIESLAGEHLLVDINAEIDGSTLDGFLAIWDADGERLTYNQGSWSASDPRISDFFVPADGVYYVSIQENDDDGGGAGYSYTLRILLTE